MTRPCTEETSPDNCSYTNGQIAANARCRCWSVTLVLLMSQLHNVQTKPESVQRYVVATSLDAALTLLAECGQSARLIAGGTDLVLELARNARPGVEALVDLSGIEGLAELSVANGRVELGALVTHNDIVGAPEMRELALPLAQACLEIGSPQLRNRATVVGNVVTASPANDTISALYALDADIAIASKSGTRTVAITAFYRGFRETVLADGEIVTGISFDALTPTRRGLFVKLGLRRAQAISVVHAAVVVETDESDLITDLRIGVGSVAPTVVLIDGTASLARGRSLAEVAEEVGHFTARSVSPIDDLRATAEYRSDTLAVAIKRTLLTLARNQEAETWPTNPPRLTAHVTDQHVPTVQPDLGRDGNPQLTELTPGMRPYAPFDATDTTTIHTTVNGENRSAANAVSKTLLDWLRDDIGLTGTKEGCAEGECGACTVHMNGEAVLACLVPASRADGADITTVEGIAEPGLLDPVQAAFEACGGVQCGYCTPGFVMSTTMLVRELDDPTREQIEHGLSGNLCRCTGYYSIIDAVQRVAAEGRGER